MSRYDDRMLIDVHWYDGLESSRSKLSSKIGFIQRNNYEKDYKMSCYDDGMLIDVHWYDGLDANCPSSSSWTLAKGPQVIIPSPHSTDQTYFTRENTNIFTTN